MTAAYERRDGETSAAWAAFEAFRSLPPDQRSLASAYRATTGRKSQAPGYWRDWASTWAWEERAAEWDRVQDAAARKAHLQAIVKARKTQADRFEAAQRVLTEPILELMQRIRDRRIDLSRLGDGDVLRMALAASNVLPKLAEAQLRALGLEAEEERPREFVGEAKSLPSDVERSAAVAAAMEELGWSPRPAEVVVEAVVRELPRRAS